MSKKAISGYGEALGDVSRAPIRPDTLAAKLAALRNFECPRLWDEFIAEPRLGELLWFIQDASRRPGGLAKLAENFLACFPGRLGTATMRRIGDRTYTLEEKATILRELPWRWRPKLPVELGTLKEALSDSAPREVAAMDAKDRAALKRALAGCDRAVFRDCCRLAALSILPGCLAALCTQKGKGLRAAAPEPDVEAELLNDLDVDDYEGTGFEPWPGPGCEAWFFEDLPGALFQFMDRQGAEIERRLAKTEVVRKVFTALDFALAERAMVLIEGSSRFGKTEAIRAWCEMRPGVARLVTVPCGNAVGDFLKRVAEALGIEYGQGSNRAHLKERVEYVIHHSGLFLVFDEAAFLLPQNYSASTPPHRLEWVRTELADRGLPVALAVTPQGFKGGMDRYVRKTHYAIEQFLGRIALTEVLPASLTEQEVKDVARVHFPELSEDALGYLANEARLSPNYLQALEAMAKYARHVSRGRGRIGLRELEAAVNAVLPCVPRQALAPLPATCSAPVSRPVTGALKPHCRPHLHKVCATAPAALENSISDTRSLRGAGPEGQEAELISAGA